MVFGIIRSNPRVKRLNFSRRLSVVRFDPKIDQTFSIKPDEPLFKIISSNISMLISRDLHVAKNARLTGDSIVVNQKMVNKQGLILNFD